MRRYLLGITVLTFALAGPCARPAPAQEGGAPASRWATLTGRVTDPQGAGVPGAVLTLYGREPRLRLSAVTDREGAYTFERLAPGEYLVEADARGFAPATAHRVRVSGGARTALDITLELAGVRAEVVVTASDTAQPIDEVSKAITTVTRREADERNEFSLAEALRTVPGLRLQQFGGPGAFAAIKLRGLRSQDTAILFDGLRFRDPSAVRGDASGYIAELDLVNFSRVEVLRGSGSSLYGTNAIGGVVNVVTDEGGGRLRGQLLAEGGGLGFFRGRAQVAGGAGAGRLAYSAGLSHRNVTRGVDGDDAARNTGGQGRALFRLTPAATLTARVYAADSFLQRNDDPRPVAAALPAGVIAAVPLSRAELRRYEAGVPAGQLNNGAATFIPSVNDPDLSRASRFFSGALVFAQRPTEEFGYTISYQGNRADATFRDGPAGVSFEPARPTRNELGGRVHTLNARTDFRLGRAHLVTAGYEFESETFDNKLFPADPSNNFAVDVTQRSHALFAQDQVRLLEDRLQLSAAFRAQFFSLRPPRFMPSAAAPFGGADFDSPRTAYTGDGSIAYFFRAAGTKLRAHVGSGYRAPSLFERFGSSFSSFFGLSVFGDPALAPDRSIAFDAGVDQTLASNRVRASATYFYTRLQEVIAFGPVPAPRFFGYLNTGGGLARGAELSAEAAPARALDLRASYTYTNSDERRPVLGQTRALTIPAHKFALVATQRAGRRLLFNFDLAATSDYLAPVFNPATFASLVYRFDGVLRADAGASYTLPLAESRSLRFFGLVENLTGREYCESGFRTSGRTARGGAQLSF